MVYYRHLCIFARYRYRAVIASQVGKADSYFVHRWSITATCAFLLGIVTVLSLRASLQTGVAIRTPERKRVDCRYVKGNGLPRSRVLLCDCPRQSFIYIRCAVLLAMTEEERQRVKEGATESVAP